MIAEGFELMAVGMSTVFAFLTLMVGCMKLMGKFSGTLEKIFPADKKPAATPAAAVGGAALTVAATVGSHRDKVAIAIAVAHRARG